MQNEQLIISHYHDPTDGYVYLEENDWLSDGQLSASSVIHTPKTFEKKRAKLNHLVRFHTLNSSLSHLLIIFTGSGQASRSGRICHNQCGGISVYSRHRRLLTAQSRSCRWGLCQGEQRLCSIRQVS